MTTPYLAITNGTVTATFLDGTANQDYLIESGEWTPSIATRRRSPFGGVGAYNDVEETISCLIRGTTASDCYTKLSNLIYLMDEAERWYNNEVAVQPVHILYAPPQSAIHSKDMPMRAVVLGRGDSDGDAVVSLEPEWDMTAARFVLPVTLKFYRRGLWTGAVDVVESEPTSLGYAFEFDAFTPHNRSDLVQMALTNINEFGGGKGLWLITSNPAGLVSVNASLGATGSDMTAVADENNSSTSTILSVPMTGRSVGTLYRSDGINMPDEYTSSNVLSNIYITLRGAGAATQQFGLRIVFRSADEETILQTEEVLFATDTTGEVQILSFQTIAIPKVATQFRLEFRLLQSSTSTVYVDKIWFAGVDNGQLTIVTPFFPDSIDSIFGDNDEDTALTLDHRYTTKPQPIVEWRRPSISFAPGYVGNPVVSLAHSGVLKSAVLYYGSVVWQPRVFSGVIEYTMIATRTRTYLAPI